jgi:hypothetical protein
MNKIIEYIRTLAFDFMAKGRKHPARRYVDYQHANSILLLFESDIMEKNLAVRQIISNINADGKYVAVCGYVDKKQVQQAVLPQFRIIGADDIDWLQRPHTEIIDDLLEQHFDIMLDLTTKPIRPLKYVALMVDADLKVGRTEDFQLNIVIPDSMIKEDKETIDLGTFDMPITTIYNEYHRYLTSIQSS